MIGSTVTRRANLYLKRNESAGSPASPTSSSPTAQFTGQFRLIDEIGSELLKKTLNNHYFNVKMP